MIIVDNYGGKAFPAYVEGILINQGIEGPLELRGTCASACTIMFAYARPNVCITRYSVMLFHESYPKGYAIYPPDIQKWIDKKGGLPVNNDSRYALVMSFREARKFWKVC